MTQQKYYPHIDGLRGIAVLLVLLFHLDSKFFKGGFVGVDVFFVISGYLISTILINKIDSGTFSFKDFYLRRIKRLMPAMLFMVVVTIIMAYFIFPYFLFEKTLKSATAAILSFSNIYFFNESGYFDSEAHIKPLLHTWSLAVEEQFYLIWPLLLFLVLKIKKTLYRVLLLVLLGIISLLFSQYYLSINSAAVFYLTPFRVFEFLMGTFIFWLNRFEFKNGVREFLTAFSLIGLLLISFYYNNDTPFPGFAALLPCFFSVLLIHNTGQAKFSSSFFNNKLMRWFGKISYSLYLVHWPLIVYYKFLLSKELDITAQVFLFLISTILGFLLYKFIETPFREQKANFAKSRTVRYVLSTIIILITFNTLLLKLGDKIYEGNSSTDYSLKQIEKGKNLRFKFCHDSLLNDITLTNTHFEKQVLIIGDSHAPDALNFLKIAYPNYDYRMLTEGGCPPMVSDDLKLIENFPPEIKNNCYDLMENVSKMDLSGYEYVVINVMFDWYKPENLVNYIEELKTKTPAKIIVFGNYIIFNKEFVELSPNRNAINEGDIKSIALYENELKEKSKDLYRYISKKELLTNNNVNEKFVMFTAANKPVTYDSNHLSYEFSELIADSLQSKNIKVFD